jgi:hypothetical protein
MRTWFERAIPLVPLMIATGMVASADAAPIGNLPIPIKLCLVPTLQQCLDPTFVMSKCGQSDCGPILSSEWKKEVPALTNKRAATVPVGLDGAGTVVQAKEYPYNWTQHYFGGFYSSYAGSLMRNLLNGVLWSHIPILPGTVLANHATSTVGSTVYTNPAGHVSVIQPGTLTPQSPWKADGDAINSCEEWIYKRYWTLSQFEDSALALGNDALAIFNAAFGSGGLNGTTEIKDQFGDGIAPFAFPQGAPKNAFFSFSAPPTPSSYANSGYAQWNAQFPAYDPALLAKLAAGKNHFNWTWALHQWIGGLQLAQNGNSPDAMEDLYRQQREFLDLVHHRQQIYDKYFKAYEGCTTVNLGFTQFTSCPPGAQLSQGDITVGWTSLWAADVAINEALKAADQKGCLDPKNINNCDWSPSFFVDQIEAIAAQAREPAFNRCVADTGNNFGAGGVVKEAEAGQLAGVNASNWQVNSSIFALFLYDLERAVHDVPLPTDASGKKHLGVWKSDSVDAGGDWFGGHFAYNMGFQVTGLPAGVCHANYKTQGTLVADVTVLKQKESLVDFLAESYSSEPSPGATAVHSESHFRLLGNDVYQPIQNDSSGNFNIVLDHTEKQADGLLPSISATFFVGPVPVSVSAGITGGAGFEATLQGGLSRNCGAPNMNNQLTLGVTGAFEPFVHVDGFASAGVGISGLAEVGIKGYLTLVQVELPFQLGLNIGLNNNGVLTLTPNASLDLNLSVFGGKLVVFAEALFLEAEATIVQWPGYHIDGQNLFKVNFDPVPIAEVALSTVD